MFQFLFRTYGNHANMGFNSQKNTTQYMDLLLEWQDINTSDF